MRSTEALGSETSLGEGGLGVIPELTWVRRDGSEPTVYHVSTLYAFADVPT